jgi:hypothetical protein
VASFQFHFSIDVSRVILSVTRLGFGGSTNAGDGGILPDLRMYDRLSVSSPKKV